MMPELVHLGPPYDKVPAYWLRKFVEAIELIEMALDRPAENLAQAQANIDLARGVAVQIWTDYKSH